MGRQNMSIPNPEKGLAQGGPKPLVGELQVVSDDEVQMSCSVLRVTSTKLDRSHIVMCRLGLEAK